jgi:hypothetical protein
MARGHAWRATIFDLGRPARCTFCGLSAPFHLDRHESLCPANGTDESPEDEEVDDPHGELSWW